MSIPCAAPADDPLDALIARQCGVLLLAQALEHLTWSAIRWRVDRGRWRRVCYGILVTHPGPLTRQAELWIALLAAGEDAALAGLTAAALEGFRGYPCEHMHVLVPRGRRVTRMPQLVVHQAGEPYEADVHPSRMPRRTRLARSLIDAAAWMPDDAGACAVVAAGVQQRLVRPGELRAALDRRPSLRRRRLLLRTIGDIDGGAQSLSEIDLVRLCRRHRLPRPSQQVARRDSEGRQRWLDAYWAEWGLHVEVDGAVHVEARQWWADMRRQNEVWIGGDRLLRFPAYVLRREPETVAAQVRAALRAAGWPGSPRRKQ
jgi:very-short-patch-repair endonuclease